MKHFLHTLIAIFLTTFTFSAKAQIQLGGGLAYGTEVAKLGINLRGTYAIDDKFLAAPGFTFYFKDKSTPDVSVTFSSLDLDARYNLFNINESIDIFPLAGLNIFRGKVKSDITGVEVRNNGTQAGLNLGLGAQVETLSNLNYFGEYKYTVGGINQSVITGGILYRF